MTALLTKTIPVRREVYMSSSDRLLLLLVKPPTPLKARTIQAIYDNPRSTLSMVLRGIYPWYLYTTGTPFEISSTGAQGREGLVLSVYINQQVHLSASGAWLFPHPGDVLVARIARVDGRVRVRQHVDGRLPVLLAGGPQRPHGGNVPGPTGSLLAAAGKLPGGAPAIWGRGSIRLSHALAGHNQH